MANKIIAEKSDLFFEKQALASSMLKEGTPAEFWGLDSSNLHQIYLFACDLYDAGRYEDAADVYLLLTALNPKNAAFWKGLGFSSHQLQDHTSAVFAYENAIALEEGNAELYPYFIQVLCELHREDLVQMALNNLLEQPFENSPQQLENLRNQGWVTAQSFLKKEKR